MPSAKFPQKALSFLLFWGSFVSVLTYGYFLYHGSGSNWIISIISFIVAAFLFRTYVVDNLGFSLLIAIIVVNLGLALVFYLKEDVYPIGFVFIFIAALLFGKYYKMHYKKKDIEKLYLPDIVPPF